MCVCGLAWVWICVCVWLLREVPAVSQGTSAGRYIKGSVAKQLMGISNQHLVFLDEKSKVSVCVWLIEYSAYNSMTDTPILSV